MEDDVLDDDTALTKVSEALDFTGTSYTIAISAGLVVALACVGYVWLVYIPSFVSTVLKFRSGEIKSLNDRSFLQYRKNLDQVTVLFGSAFWGTFFSCLSGGILTGLIVGLIFQAGDGNFGSQLGGQIVGCVRWIGSFVFQVPVNLYFSHPHLSTDSYSVVLGLKMAILAIARASYFSCFYRKHPAAANMFYVVMEVWNLALSVGFIVARTLKFFFVSIWFIPRLDTPFLAEGNGRIGGTEIDRYPQVFRKDLLMHEAHRHPYIERLGLMFLLKLQLGDRFGRAAHSRWRLLLTLSLMPWMRRYRVIVARTDIDEYIADLEDGVQAEKDGSTEDRRATMRKLALAKSVRDISESHRILGSNAMSLEAQLSELKRQNKILQDKLQRYQAMEEGSNLYTQVEL